MIKHGSKMIQAVSNARVPKISLYIGASFGAGNYGMCGWSYQPDFLFAWPNARTGVMAGQSAADTMSEVARVGAARKGQEVPEEMLEQRPEDVLRRAVVGMLPKNRLRRHRAKRLRIFPGEPSAAAIAGSARGTKLARRVALQESGALNKA